MQAASAADPGDFFLLQKRVGYKLLYPSRVPLGSSYGEAIETGEPTPYRVYKLGKHGKALAVDARTALDSSHAWGLRYTTWIDAPILEQPTQPGLLGQGRQVRVYTERRGHPPHRRLLRRRALQGGRRRGRLDRQLARRQAVARDDDRDREEPRARAPGAGLILAQGGRHDAQSGSA